MNVWTYWEGPRPPYIDVCLATIREHCPDTVVVTPDTLHQWLDTDLSGPVHKRSDVIRAALLAKYGGLWIDADTVMIRTPEPVPHDRDLTYSVWNDPPRRVLNGYIYARAGCPLAIRWRDLAESALLRGDDGWSACGERILTPLADLADPRELREMPLDTFIPLDFDANPRGLLTGGDWRDYVTENTVGFGLNNSWLMARHREQMSAPVEAMKDSQWTVHRLIYDAWERMNA